MRVAAVHAAERAVFVDDLDENSPGRQLRLGFDAGYDARPACSFVRLEGRPVQS